MARARNIKPGLFKNEVLGVADPLLTILFEGLWVLADRDGKLEDRPMRIKAEIFPYREGLSVDEMLNWLQANGFIRRYVAKGQKCIAVLEFVKHQNPHKNEAPSELPDREPEEIGTHREPVGTASDFLGSTRADSLSTDSGFLIPDNSSPDIGADAPALPEKVKARKDSPSQPDGVSDQTWADWLQLRRAKKAPVTATVIAGAQDEARKAGLSLEAFLKVWCRRGSQGLEADWLKPQERGSPGSGPVTFADKARERMDALTGRKPAPATKHMGDIFDAAKQLDH